jgi:hypothetical protein
MYLNLYSYICYFSLGGLMSARSFFLTTGFFLISIPISSQSIQHPNYLPVVEKQQNQIIIKIKPIKMTESYFINYRTEGMKNYQVRKMQADTTGTVFCHIPTENLYGKTIEYFVVERRMDGSSPVSLVHTITNFTQINSPEIYFQDNEVPASQGRKKEAFLNVNGSLSTASKISDNSEYPGQNYTANGNLRIYKNILDNDSQFDFDTNFTHLDPRNEETEKRINLTSMMIRFKKGDVQFEVGDVSVNETEYTTSYLNRRGLRLELNGKTLYLNSFYTNSQQKTGFDGYGIPDDSAGIFGTVAGVNIKDFMKIRGLFMTGKDNLDSKTVYSNQNPYRSGDMYSLWSEINLLKNSLQVSGEISSSTYGSAQEEQDVKKVSDTAWKAGIKYNRGILSVDGNYEEIGDQFNSIANLFLQNDREGLSTNLGLNFKTLSWNISYLDKTNYMHSLVQDMLHQKRAGTSINWGIGTHFRIGGEFSRDNLDYDSSTGLQTSSSDMNTYTYTASLGYIAGATGINLNLGRTESIHFTSNLNASLALNLRFGQFMSLNPSLSYQSNENLGDGSKSTIYNFYLNSEITFIPQYFTLTISTSYMNNESDLSKSSSWNAGVNLNFFMAEIFKNKVRPSLSIKSMFQGAKYGETKTDSAIFTLQADISF